MNLKYFLPTELESDIQNSTKILNNGDYDYIDALYSNVSVSPSSDGTEDPFKIAKVNYPTKAYV